MVYWAISLNFKSSAFFITIGSAAIHGPRPGASGFPRSGLTAIGPVMSGFPGFAQKPSAVKEPAEHRSDRDALKPGDLFSGVSPNEMVNQRPPVASR